MLIIVKLPLWLWKSFRVLFVMRESVNFALMRGWGMNFIMYCEYRYLTRERNWSFKPYFRRRPLSIRKEQLFQVSHNKNKNRVKNLFQSDHSFVKEKKNYGYILNLWFMFKWFQPQQLQVSAVCAVSVLYQFCLVWHYV